MIIKELSLWLGERHGTEVVYVSQYDNMWRFKVSLIYNSQPWQIPTGATAVLNGKKPDGNVFAFSGTIANNTVTVDADVQMTAVAGKTACELSILSDGKVVGTANFILNVEAAPKSPDDVSSESTLPAYGEILDRIEEMWGGGGGGSVTVDDALSGTSENPVQNKVIKAALDGKTDDVQINGSSIVSSGIANIPKASESNFGVAKVYAYGDPPIRMVRLENSGNGVFSVPMLDANGHIRLAVLPEATTSSKGAMSASDKSKLDGIETGAQVNPDLSGYATKAEMNTALENKADAVLVSPGDTHVNVFNPQDEDVAQGYLTTKGRVNASYSYWTTGYIPVTSGCVIRLFYGSKGVPVAYAAEFSSKSISAFISRTEIGSYYNYTVANDGYLRLSIKTSAVPWDDISHCMVTIDDVDSTFVEYGVVDSGSMGLMSAADKRKLDSLRAVVAAPRTYGKFFYTSYSSFGACPPNSVPHFEYCAANDYDWIKCDIRPSSDGGLICCHDAGFTLDGNGRVTTYNSSNATLIHDMTTAQCLALEYAKAYNGTYYHVCTVEDFLVVCKKYGKTPYITIRDEYVSDVVAPKLIAALKSYALLETAIINSSSRDSLSAIRKLAPSITMCLFFNPFGSSMASGYRYCVADGNTIASYYYTQSEHTWSEFATDTTVAEYITLCRQNNIPMIAGIESDDSHTDTLISMGFSGNHTMQDRVSATVNIKSAESEAY